MTDREIEERAKEMMGFYAGVKSPMDDFDYYEAALATRPEPVPAVYLRAFGEDSRDKGIN